MSNAEADLPEVPLWVCKTRVWKIFVGGIPETAHWGFSEEKQSGWAVVGVGILVGDGESSVLRKADWERLLAADRFEPDRLDGHFFAVRWNRDGLECWNDRLGLRTGYVYHHDGATQISTRIDILARVNESTEFSREGLGAAWLLQNSMAGETVCRGVSRLGGGSALRFRGNGEEDSYSRRVWIPDFAPVSPDRVSMLLKSIVGAAFRSGMTPSLGLSGGLDSRTLLAVVDHLNRERNPLGWRTHTFGPVGDPDVDIPAELRADRNDYHLSFDDPLPSGDEGFRALANFAARTSLVEPVTSYLKLRYYPRLRERNFIDIDGGFGEVARRVYMNRVLLFGRSAILKRDSGTLVKLMSSSRPDIFAPELKREMDFGARSSVSRALAEMPPPDQIGWENFADLFIVRTRIPHYGGPGQEYIDGEILNFMPFAQPSYLAAALGLPPKWRRGARLYRGLIHTFDPRLERFPLTKSGVKYRYSNSDPVAWAMVNMKKRLSGRYVDPQPERLLLLHKERILDTIHSVRTNRGVYDMNKIKFGTESYFKGNRATESTVIWWLTFELWVQSGTFPH